MTLTGESLGAAIDASDPACVADLLLAAGESGRRSCDGLVRRYLSGARERAGLLLRDRDGQYAALGLAVLGTARSPAAAAEMLNEIDVSSVRSLASEIIGSRPASWREEFCRHAFGPAYIPATFFATSWFIVRALVRAGSVPKPSFPHYITFLPAVVAYQPATLDEFLRADPGLLADEVFDLFAVEGAGGALRHQDGWVEHSNRFASTRGMAPRPDRTWRVTLAKLAAERVVDRGRLLDACLGAFLRDFRPSELSWYAGFHSELAPDTDEMAARSATYLRLLAADGVAAGVAQQAVAKLVKAGRIDPAEVVEASPPALARPEKKYVLGQLRILDAVARRSPGLAGRTAEQAAIALEHGRTDVQEAALDFIARHGRNLAPGVWERLRDAAAALAPSLRPRAEAVLGAPGNLFAAGAPNELAAVAAEAAVPRLGGLSELPEVVAALTAGPVGGPPSSMAEAWDPVLIEQLLDGIARFAADRHGFAAALAPQARRLHDREFPQFRVLSRILRPEGGGRGSQDVREVPAMSLWNNRRQRGASPGLILTRRLHEVYTRAWRGESRPLLGYPDTGSGHVDPVRITAELAVLEDTGAEPWPADFTQMLLRLPRYADERVIAAATRLISPAGKAFAAALRHGGIPDPVPSLTSDRWGETAVTLSVDPRAPVGGDLLPAIWELDDPWTVNEPTIRITLRNGRFERRPERAHRSSEWFSEAAELLVWAHALPSHREVAAAHATAILIGGIEPPRVYGPIDQFITRLPDMQGPAGPAVNLAIICALTAHDPARRAAAVDALTGFARTGGLDGAALGRQLSTENAVMLNRVAAPLQSAAEAGANALVWQIASAALPGLLGPGTRGTHQLLTVAANVAAGLGIRGHIDGLAEAAANPKAGRLRTEARRLQQALTARAPLGEPRLAECSEG
jgi:Family of unknown function (DUF6493)